MNRLACVVALWLAAGMAAAGASDTAAVRALGSAFADVYDKVAPSVVVLEVTRPGDGASSDGFSWDFLFRDPRTPRRRAPAQESEGSGVIIRPDGYILTNAHVIEGADPERGVVARRQDGTRLPLTVIGVDERSDLAVLKADADGLPAIEWGDSDTVRVGEFACGIGAPFELDYTLTVGVISAKGRSNLTNTIYEDYLQTDAAINPGNSGGPLCDLDGRVIGVNTLINGLSRGLSFAIPSNFARAISDEIIAHGRIVRPWLGIHIETLAANAMLQEMMGLERGVLVRSIEPDAPASRSRLRPADVIVAVDDEEVSTARELQQAVLKKGIGQAVELKVWRRGGSNGSFRTIEVITEELPVGISTASGTMRPMEESEEADVPEMPGLETPRQDFSAWGLELQDLPDEAAEEMGFSSGGVVVTRVELGSAAALAGLQPRDLITAVGDYPVKDIATFSEALAAEEGGPGTKLLVEREGQQTYAILKP